MNDLLDRVMEDRKDVANAVVSPEIENIKPGTHIWLYFDWVRQGFSRKLAHLWHGPFRISARIGDHLVKLELKGTDYRFYHVVHMSRLKLRREYPKRPVVETQIPESDRFDFDEALLPEDSFDPDKTVK